MGWLRVERLLTNNHQHVIDSLLILIPIQFDSFYLNLYLLEYFYWFYSIDCVNKVILGRLKCTQNHFLHNRKEKGRECICSVVYAWK